MCYDVIVIILGLLSGTLEHSHQIRRILEGLQSFGDWGVHGQPRLSIQRVRCRHPEGFIIILVRNL
jgi:hypothetical protein